MSASEQEIQSFLDELRPIFSQNIPEDERDCPICLDPYPLYSSYTPLTDYPVCRTQQIIHSTCEHVFGRLCIERHIRGGGTTCPMCREVWIGMTVAISEGDASDEAPSRRARRRRQRNRRRTRDMAVEEDDEAARLQIMAESMRPTQVSFLTSTASDEEVEAPSQGRRRRRRRRRNRSVTIDDHEEVWPLQAVAQFIQPVHATLIGSRNRARHDRIVDEDLPASGRVHRTIGFLERMLSTYDMREVNDDNLRRIRDAESAVDRLWQGLDERQG